MSAALALAAVPAASAPATGAERSGASYRAPDLQFERKFRPKIRELFVFAAQHRLRLVWVTLTSCARGSDERVLEDLKRCWTRCRHRAAWRKAVGMLVVFAAHSRPHIHALVLMPPGLSQRDLRRAWYAGVTDSSSVHVDAVEEVDGDAGGTDDADRLAAYCAAQRGLRRLNLAFRRRSYSYRPPSPEHLDCKGPAASAPLQVLASAAPSRAGAGGGLSFCEARSEGQRVAPSLRPQAEGERPEAGGAATVPEAGAELNYRPPHCGSERHIRLVPPTLESHMRPDNTDVPVRSDLYTAHEVQIAILHLRSFIPRDRIGALMVNSIAHLANLNAGLAEEAMMRLLWANQVKRRKDGKWYLFWAGPRLPAPVPVVVPGRLRMFFAPPSFAPASPGPASHDAQDGRTLRP